ncbi:MAG: hypothetical protein M3Q08_13855 [Pseudomonadota bacterium]|nr:hypothetical protein [Pseudomonadota bacterium]
MKNPSTVRWGYGIMFAAVVLNLAYNSFVPPALPWAVLPIALYTTGMSLAMPSITLLTLDMFPRLRGMAASMQSFIQTMVMTFTSALLAPLLGSSGTKLAIGLLFLMLAGFAAWFIYAQTFPPEREKDKAKQ